MKTRTLATIMMCAIALGGMAVPPAPTPRWEQVDLPAADTDEDVSVAVRDGVLYVWMSRGAKVQLFTILGQPVAEATLQAGWSRLILPARGIYILKTGSLAKRITV